MSLLGGKWINLDGEAGKKHRCETALPRLFQRGAAAARIGSQWECDCGGVWEVKLTDGWRRWSDTGKRLTRTEVVERMMLALPAESSMKPDYPGDDTIRSAFLVALYALDRLNLNGGWRPE